MAIKSFFGVTILDPFYKIDAYALSFLSVDCLRFDRITSTPIYVMYARKRTSIIVVADIL